MEIIEVEDEVERKYTLEIHGLTEDQFNTLSRGVTDSVRKDPRSKAVRFVGNAIGVASGMSIVASFLWLTAYIVTNFPGR